MFPISPSIATLHFGQAQVHDNVQIVFTSNAWFYELGLTRELTNPRVGVIPSLILV